MRAQEHKVMFDHLFVGGGEMGALMRSHNWSQTPLGSVETWSQSLRTSLGILLASGFPMYIAWGPDFIQFYNDDYRPILGSTKHPAALGQSASECFSEIWDLIGPMFEQVIASGKATSRENQLVPLNRNGYVEECYFTFSYSAIPGEGGQVGGVLVTVIETTKQVLGEQRSPTQQEVNAAIQRSEKRSQLAIRIAQLGTWRYDPDTNLVELDERMREIWGEREDAVVLPRSRVMERIHPDDLEQVASAVGAALDPRSSGVYEIDYRIVWDDGTERWISANGQVTFAGEGEFRQAIEFLGTALDISDRKQVEAALRQSEEQSRNILESITDAFFAVDENWLFTYVNHTAGTLVDRAPEDLIGKSFWSEFPGVNGSEFEQLHRRVATERVAGSVTQFYPDHNRWYEVRTYPAANGVTMYFKNVTDRIQAEAALRQTSAELERQLQKFNAVMSSVPDFIYIFDLSGRFIDVNKPLLDLWQKTFAEAMGKNFVELDYPLDLAVKLQNQIQQVIQTRQPLKDETPYTSALGTRAYEYIFVPIFDAEGTVEMVAGVTRDITERKQAEAEREKLLQQEQAAREAAEQANRIKDEFLAVLSHELRSPLNPILGWTRLLQNGKLDEVRKAEALAMIERNAKLQTQLIEDLLDISRIMQGKLILTPAPVNLTFVISAAVETVRLAAEAKNIQIVLDLDNAIAPISGDAARLQQVLWNLLTNAVKFTPNGGGVTVELRQFDRLAQIRVMDTGKGISLNFLPHVFEYFRQEDGSTTRKFGGLGLGLAIVRQIVEMHGGTVSAQSKGENQGAIFIVQLPVIQQAAPIVSEPIHTQADTEAPLDNIQILLVDDDTDTCDFQAFLLEQSGAKVTAVASGLEALQVLEQFIPDVLVSDVGMASMDGYMLMQQIRSRPAAQGGIIPAIAITAYAGEFDQQRAIQAGFQMHITKPLDPEILVSGIVNLLKQNRL